MLDKFDATICDYTQEAYLYLLDRFGLRVGDVVCALTLAHCLTLKSLSGYAAAFVCIGLGCFIAALQRAGHHQHINRAADLMRSMVVLRVALVAFAVFDVATGRQALWDQAINVALIYLLTCKVRDRDADRFRQRRTSADMASQTG